MDQERTDETWHYGLIACKAAYSKGKEWYRAMLAFETEEKMRLLFLDFANL